MPSIEQSYANYQRLQTGIGYRKLVLLLREGWNVSISGSRESQPLAHFHKGDEEAGHCYHFLTWEFRLYVGRMLVNAQWSWYCKVIQDIVEPYEYQI